MLCHGTIWLYLPKLNLDEGDISRTGIRKWKKKECILLSLENFCIQIPSGHTLVLYFSWCWLVAKLHSTTWTSLLPNVSWSQYNNQLRLCCHVYTPSSSMWAKQHLKEVRKKEETMQKLSCQVLISHCSLSFHPSISRGKPLINAVKPIPEYNFYWWREIISFSVLNVQTSSEWR